jgi:hypothetical protein
MKWTAVAMLVVACGRGGDKQRREGSAVAVEVVTQADASSHEGPASDEIEPNDSDDTATPLPLGTTMRGKIDPADADVDHYRIDVASAGALTASLSGVDGVDLALEIEDSTGTVIAKSDRGAARIKEGVPNLAVTPGRYTAVVHGKRVVPKKNPKDKKPEEPTGPAPVYEITASVAPIGKGIEREPDDDRGTANDLIVGDTATGFIGWAGDVDVWKLSVEALSAKDAVDIEISAVEGVSLTLEIADGVGQTLVTRKAPRGAPLIVRGLVPVVPAGAPPFHYLTIKGDRSNPETAYQLHVSAHVVPPDGETEPDDTPDKPMQVPPDRTIVHATWTPGDVDCFALQPSDAARTLDVTVDTQGEIDLGAELLVDGKSVAKADHHVKGAAEKVGGFVPPGGHVVVRVKGEGSSEGAYNLVVQESPAP